MRVGMRMKKGSCHLAERGCWQHNSANLAATLRVSCSIQKDPAVVRRHPDKVAAQRVVSVGLRHTAAGSGHKDDGARTAGGEHCRAQVLQGYLLVDLEERCEQLSWVAWCYLDRVDLDVR